MGEGEGVGVPGGGGGARSALKSRGGGFASGPCFFVWQARGPLGPRAAKRRRPPGPLRFSAGQTSHPPPLSYLGFLQTKRARRSP